jgi:hypothetical protein
MATDGMSYRAADADRRRVEELLRTAYNDGRLTLVEFEDRLERVHESRTYRDLEAILVDLPYDHSFLRAYAGLPDQRPAQPRVEELAPNPTGVRALRVVAMVFVTLLGLAIIPSSPVVGGLLLAIMVARVATARRRRRPVD